MKVTHILTVLGRGYKSCMHTVASDIVWLVRSSILFFMKNLGWLITYSVDDESFEAQTKHLEPSSWPSEDLPGHGRDYLEHIVFGQHQGGLLHGRSF